MSSVTLLVNSSLLIVKSGEAKFTCRLLTMWVLAPLFPMLSKGQMCIYVYTERGRCIKHICVCMYLCCCCCCWVASVVSDSVRPHRWQPTRLLCLWDSPGKNTGLGCHFLLQAYTYIGIKYVWGGQVCVYV